MKTMSGKLKYLFLAFFFFSLSAFADSGILTGDTRLACEALLCLSSSERPSECNPALNRYFGIKKKTSAKTAAARRAFLSLCPVSNQTADMSRLVSALASGAGRCDATSLNLSNLIWSGEKIMISDRLPDYCAAYIGHEYTDVGIKYVGTPEKEGYWVDANNYERALAEYNAAQQQKQADYAKKFGIKSR